MKQSRVLKSVLFTVMSLAALAVCPDRLYKRRRRDLLGGRRNEQLARSESGRRCWFQMKHSFGGSRRPVGKKLYLSDGRRVFRPLVRKAEGLVDGEGKARWDFSLKSVDGETVDDANQEWWCLTKGGESLMTGADSTPIADGDQFELTLTVGY